MAEITSDKTTAIKDDMNKNSDDPKKVSWLPLWLTFSVIIFFWGMSIIALCWLFPNIGVRGQFGDSFGAINALFAGLAFAGVIFAIILQKKELELQRQELKETRDEIRGQKEQLQAQDQTLQKQNFENSFFQLLSFHNEIVNSLEIPSGIGNKVGGRMCFHFFLQALKENYGPRNLKTSEQIKDRINVLYEKFLFRDYLSIGYYFRHLYNTVKFVHEHKFIKELEDKKTYTNLIRAQLSSNELGLLFYDCLSDRGAKFKCLVEKYELLEDLDFEKLLDPEHRSLYNERAYGESAKKENGENHLG